MKYFVIILLLISGTAYSQTDTTAVFYSGFEEGNKDIWNDFDDNPDSTNLIMLHPGPLNNPNNHVMRFRVPPGRGGADLVKILPKSYDKLYFRWYQMWEPGYDFTARNHGSGLYGGSRNLLGMSGNRPDGSNFFISTFEPDNQNFRPFLYTYYRGMYMDCVNPNGQCWGDHFPCWLDEGQNVCDKPEHRERILPQQLETGRWYCFEMMIDAGTPVQNDAQANGILNYWIDGVEYGPWNDLWFRTTPNLKLTILWLSLFHHAEHSIEGILFDEITVSTEYIGCKTVNSIIATEHNNIRPVISPNPVKNFIIVTGYSGYAKIFDIVGTEVWSGEVNDNTKIDLSDLSNGVYFLRVQNKTLLFVKNN
jgi:hypothetical protein